ncbi:MAG TPA: hypothetical protein VHL57_10520 [Flavobacteriales bacterium]|nr:hypothetical protein [Flavobacteriales bacterium]
MIENMLGGTPPYTYGLPVDGIDAAGFPFFHVPDGACGGTMYQMLATDANGCTGLINNIIAEPQQGAGPLTIASVTGSCTGESNGSVTLTNVYDSW